MTTINYTDEQIQAMAQPLFDAMEKRVSTEEMALMHKAFDLAREAHASQKRKTGEPYIIHPIAVARILGEEFMLGANPVCAGFLHDVVEDTPYTIKDIKEMFGSDIAFLVDVVTKQKKTEYVTSKQVDNFKQMLNSINYDIRALLVKLADRLHNMRTLSSMRPDKQMKIAGETDYFYAPLANRLGLYPVKIELENLSFSYRCPREHEKIEKLLKEDKEYTKPVVDNFIAKANEVLKANGIDAFIECEYRRPFSIRRKMLKTGQDFNHIEHKKFVRIVFSDSQGLTEKGMAMKIYALLSDVFKEKPKSMANYIDSPKQNGYQSLHGEFLDDSGQWMEVHISSERMRRFSRLGCVADREEGNISKWIEGLKSTLQDIAYHNHEIDFMEGVTTSFYNDDIMVFTPKGKAISLPQGASALDFAFEIHTDIGMHAKYARINGKLNPIFSRLHRGDCVEIGTDENAMPMPLWLDNVKTYKAMRHIRTYLAQQSAPAYDRCTCCKPIPGDEVIGIKGKDGKITIHKRDCAVAIRLASQNGDSVEAVDFIADDSLYPVAINVLAVDRSHLMSELIDCITNELRLPISAINTHTDTDIVECDIDFFVHSYNELQKVVDSLTHIPGVDEVVINGK